ncbi:hypothetical protein [Roseovarius ramblicola]|uniref:Uncharacterized protein n=1 Tax=Roseovarius ramblicola TaxID=2022336 RepID=A0ABV5HX79_9RHOB
MAREQERIVGNSAAVRFAVIVVALTASTGGVFANGLGENRSWQFDTSADKANKAFVADLIERQKGGFFDGFDNNFITNNDNTTNIGTQINCTNAANATGNIADNQQAGPTTVSNSDPDVIADSTGNIADNQANSDGASSGADPSVGGSQDNSGNVDSSVSNSDINSGVSGVSNGDTDQTLTNNQDNSGNQNAGVDGSTACNMDNSTITGEVATGSGPLNAGDNGTQN